MSDFDLYPSFVWGQVALLALCIAAIAFTAWFAADVLTADLRTRVRYWLGITVFCGACVAAIMGVVWLIS